MGIINASGTSASDLSYNNTILGGNGNYIPPLINNSTLIACDDFTPTESDTLYYGNYKLYPLWVSAGKVQTLTANHTATTTDWLFLCDTTTGAITITLPDPAGLSGKHWIFKKIASSHSVTIDTADDSTIDGSATFTMNGNANVARTTASGTAAVATADSDELLASMKLKKGSFASITTASAGEHSIPVTPRLPGTSSLPTDRVSPLMIISRMARLLDQQNVDTNGRFLVVDPIFVEMLKDEDSRLLNSDFGGSGLQNGLVLSSLHGFKVYVSNNLPAIGTGPGTAGTANQNDNYGIIVAGHESAVATAETITKTETYRDPDSFADIVRGMHVYGRKILRAEGIVRAKYNVA